MQGYHIAFLGRSTPTTAIWWSNLILCQYNVDTLKKCVKEFGLERIIFVCTDFTETFFSKLRSAGLNYYLPSFFTDSYCAGVSNKHCLLTFFIVSCRYIAICCKALCSAGLMQNVSDLISQKHGLHRVWLIVTKAWVKIFRIMPEFRILRLTFHKKSASKCWIRQILIASLIDFRFILGQLTI